MILKKLLAIGSVFFVLCCSGTKDNKIETTEIEIVDSSNCQPIDCNDFFHISYCECGNGKTPTTTDLTISGTNWVEILSSFGTGKAFVDDAWLERSDQPGKNLLTKNAGFEDGVWEGRKNNPMCLYSDTWCKDIIETDDTFVWYSSDLAYNGELSAACDMSKLGTGWQTHIFYPLIDISDIPAGIKFSAKIKVLIKGDVQVRIGIDLRESPVNPNNPRENIIASNSAYLQGDTNGEWVEIRLP